MIKCLEAGLGEAMWVVLDAAYPQAPTWTVDALDHFLSRPHAQVFAYEDQGNLLALAQIQVLAGEAELLNLAVLPAHQRQGLGQKLLSEASDQLKSQGMERMFLEVRATNLPAQTLYRKLGFERLAIRQNYYQDGEDAWIYCLQV
ncbi:ribosomal protein S18-alanine N-acetyltransferase [Aerococcus sp. UMB9870]|uniref:ribosomal protein S18-alanine N-acetyltransferase n=1 Tax=Aerococcus sp. UMB9870 TaxID=3046351 RepID=UPI00254B9CB1|nr:ribosomal protein S18-alanine N-acetyltransferase [Aerococcus sp. UMB9870]MDK6369624.1 ribosomal protein S18-alanine N-acetyltransferase [Aerococcus sp. UMB9870]